jgi:hypothetical protein
MAPPANLKENGIRISGKNANISPIIALAVLEALFAATNSIISESANIAAMIGYTISVLKKRSHHCLKYFSVPGSI